MDIIYNCYYTTYEKGWEYVIRAYVKKLKWLYRYEKGEGKDSDHLASQKRHYEFQAQQRS